MAKSPPKWLKLLDKFCDNLRIMSREESVKPNERGTKLVLWDSQRRIINEVAAGLEDGIHKFYVLKSRQLGSSTAFVIIMIFWIAFHKRTKAALVVDQEKTRDEFREVIRNIIGSIPPTYFGGKFAIKTGGDNKHHMIFMNGAEVWGQLNFLVAGTSGSKVAWGESSGYSLVMLTELANYGSEDGLSNFEEALSETNPERLYVYESTAKGRNHWYDRWQAAADDPYTIRRIFVGWWSKPQNAIPRDDARFHVYGLPIPDGRDAEKIRLVFERFGHKITPEQLAWRRWRSGDKSRAESALEQNQPWLPEEAFVVAGRSYFQTRLVGHDLERMGQTPYKAYRFWVGKDFWAARLERLVGEERRREIELRVWHEPMPNGEYVIGVDPAGGSDEKNNNHAISIWRCYADKLVQVAEYADNMSETRHCAWVLAYLAGIYRNCVINLELSGGYGKQVMVELEHLRDNLRADYNSEKRGASGQDLAEFLSAARYYIYKRPDAPGSAGYILNFYTTGDLKRQIFSGFRDAHMNGALEINSRPLLEEMIDVVQDGSEIGAPGRQKDDRVFSACLANHAYVQHVRQGMMMRGETFKRISEEEAGIKTGGHIVDRIVAQTMETFRNYEFGVGEKSPERQWAEDRGLS